MFNEIQQVIVLAAGRSRRMESLSDSLPKCLLPYQGERILERLIRQVKSQGVKKIVITTGYRADVMKKLFGNDPCIELVENKLYEEDVNIYSMHLALSKIDGPCAVFEADTVMEDALVKYVLGSDFDGKSIWFTRGKFNEAQYGGILKADKCGNVTDVRIVPAYKDAYKSYEKLTGLMRIGPNEIARFKSLIGKYAKATLKQYYLNAWIENVNLLPSQAANVEMFEFFSFNKPEEYYQVQNTQIGLVSETPVVELISTEGLQHIEDFDPQRVAELKEKIKKEALWTVPIIVEKKNKMVLDGQHRMEVAKAMGLKQIPAIVVDYNDVKVWTLRREYPVSQRKVYAKVNSGNYYPYKTVKHKFSFTIPEICIELDKLK